MSVLFRCRIPMKPKGKGRPRVARGRAYTPPSTARWERAAATYLLAEYAHLEPLSGAMALSVVAVTQPPRTRRKADGPLSGWRPKKPDGDNVLKMVGDALVKAHVIEDDRHIAEWRVRSVYALSDVPEGVYIEITRPRDVESTYEEVGHARRARGEEDP